MLSSIIQGVFGFVIQLIIEVVFHVGCYYLGRIVVPLFSVGRIQCDGLTEGAARHKWKWTGIYSRRNGRVYLSSEATCLAGLLFVFLLIGIGFLLYARQA